MLKGQFECVYIDRRHASLYIDNERTVVTIGSGEARQYIRFNLTICEVMRAAGLDDVTDDKIWHALKMINGRFVMEKDIYK